MDYFGSDHHFDHKNIISHCKRPFATVAEMNEYMIQEHNKIVKPTDRFFHLGDVTLHGSKDRISALGNALNGTKFIVPGNHDMPKDLSCFGQILNQCHMYKDSGAKIVLCHYGMRVWKNSHHGVWHLYGHSHGNLPGLGKSFDIGVDCWNFRPLSFDEIKEKMDKLPIHEVDHHKVGTE